MTAQQKFFREIVLPVVYPITIIALTITLIVLVGEVLLNVVDHSASSEFRRPELWVGTFLTIGIIALAALIVSRPAGSLGKLDEPVAIGSRPLLADPLPPVDVLARRGPLGSTADIEPGYVLYARNGQLGIAREMLRDVPAEVGYLRQGFVYVQGVHGANDQMWIPLEAVSAVYPETRSAFLAIAGDEMEAYGWQNPPASFNLNRTREVNKLY
ncbi:MAG TPA: hypothetical protein PK691_09335 [Thermomicrobiales bacterium]|nr:hypothetical protein [Thermomicrobiales bacterium]